MKQMDSDAKRARLLADLPPLHQILRGSLLHRTIRHKRGCLKCAQGGGHPVLVLSVGYPGGKSKQFTVHPSRKADVVRWLKNYQTIKARLEALCELNHAFLHSEEE